MKVKLTFTHEEVLEGIHMMMTAKGVPLVAIEQYTICLENSYGNFESTTKKLQVIASFDADAYSSGPVVASPDAG